MAVEPAATRGEAGAPGPDLAAFLARHTPLAAESAVWGGGTLPLRITSYLAGEPPPLAYVTSANSLVFRRDLLLVGRNRDGVHIVPGGRREAGETLEATLRREVLEETGWTIAEVSALGFMLHQHLGPGPPDYAYPYPHFVRLIYTAEAATFAPEAIVPDDYELGAAFRPIAEVRSLALTPAERLFLDAALRRRGPR